MSNNVKEPLFPFVSAELIADVIQGDVQDELKKMERSKFDLIITSPPYNIGKSYEVKTSIEAYLKTQQEIIGELIRVLSDRGSICWQGN